MVLGDRIRQRLSGEPTLAEMRMFGGHGFTLNGHLLVATLKDGGLLVRVGEDGRAAALTKPGASHMRMGAREMKGWVAVEGVHLDDAALAGWLQTARGFVATLPPKTTAGRTRRAKPGLKPRA